MKHDLQLSILKTLLRQLDERVSVDAGEQLRNPASSYTSPELASQEWEHFFRNHPQLIGLSGDLPESGTYLTIDDFGVPVVATRAVDGRFRAFLNACRHRGTRVAQGTRGKSRNFVCPFHHWTYSNTGALVGVPRDRDFGRLDRSCRGLIELPAEERHGQLWVHPKPGGLLDVDGLLGGLAPEMESWNVGDLVFAGESVIERNLNWKLAIDTFGETYHVDRLHRDTIAKVVHGDTLAYEKFARNHRFAFALKGIDALREKPESEWNIEGAANVVYFLFPNVQFNVGANSVSLIKIYPDAENPGRSRTRVGHYFSRDAIAASGEAESESLDSTNAYDRAAGEMPPGAGLSFVMEVFDSTIEHEDYVAAETTQQAAESGLLDCLLFGRNEPALHHFHNTYRAALGMPPLERFKG